MVFLPTARSAAIYHDVFVNLSFGCPVWEIHSRMSQSARTKATDAFRQASSGILFSSDVTARGIDVKGITSVVQVGLPSSSEQCESYLCATSVTAEPCFKISIDWEERPELAPRATESSSLETLNLISYKTERSPPSLFKHTLQPIRLSIQPTASSIGRSTKSRSKPRHKPTKPGWDTTTLLCEP